MENSVLIQDFVAGVILSFVQWTARAFGIHNSEAQRGLTFVGSIIAGLVVASTADNVAVDSFEDVFSLAIGAFTFGQATYTLTRGRMKQLISR